MLILYCILSYDLYILACFLFSLTILHNLKDILYITKVLLFLIVNMPI